MEMSLFQLIILGLEMSIFEVADAIKELYQVPNSYYPTVVEMERVWDVVLKAFEHELHAENDPLKLEACVLAGPGGFVRLESTFETMADGTSRFVTTVPYR